ncbi:MaoC family dehydratase N-terminal domain-containing protein [Chloroflexota bacterium]
MEKQVYYDDIAVGMELPKLTKGPWSMSHIVRWSAAQENWERKVNDYRYATKYEGLTDVVISGNWKKYVLAQLFKDWAGHGGWLWKLSIRYQKSHFPGDMVIAWAKVSKKYEVNGLGFVEMDCGIRNQNEEETTPSWATVVLPLRGGNEVPYPFVPPPGIEHRSLFQKGATIEKPLYITDEVRSYIGKEVEVEAWDEVCKSELRRFSQAIPDPDPLYWDEQYAQQTKFGTLVAPPLYPLDSFKIPPNMSDTLTEGIEKDPNFWGGAPGDPRIKLRIPLPLLSINAGAEFEILQLAHLGQKIVVRARITDIYEKEGKSGRIVFCVYDYEFKNKEGDIILKVRRWHARWRAHREDTSKDWETIDKE